MVSAGYKQTEAGVIPEDWECGALGSLATFGKGAGLPKSALVPDGNAECVHYGQLFTNYGAVISEVASRTSALDGAVRSSIGDVLMPTSDVTPRGLATASCLLQPEVVLGGDILVIRPDSKRLDGSYLANYIRLDKQQVLNLVSGTTVYHIYAGDMKQFVMPVPPVEEQRAIAQVLADTDRLIDSLGELIAKKENIKAGAADQLLTGATRLPGFSGDWHERCLGDEDVSALISGGTPSTAVDQFWDGDIPWVTPTDITATDGKYLNRTARRITPEGLANSSAQMLPAGTLLLCSRATVGELKIARFPVCTNQGFKSVVAGPAADAEFLYYLLATLKPLMLERSYGSTFLELPTREARSLPVTLPPIDEQHAIAQVLSDMDAELAELRSRKHKTILVKEALMDELLTGRTRLT